jgi:hypothetical protein
MNIRRILVNTISKQFLNNFCMRKITLEGGIERSFGPISVDEVKPNQYNEKAWQAQLRQEVTTTYPAARAHDSLSDGLFAADEFGEGESHVEKRVTWSPAKIDSTVEIIEEILRQNPDAVLLKTLSMEPILSAEQTNAMETGLSDKTPEDYAEKFVPDAEGEPVLFAGKPFYRSIKFKKVYEPDIDLRPSQVDESGAVQMTDRPAVAATAENADANI